MTTQRGAKVDRQRSMRDVYSAVVAAIIMVIFVVAASFSDGQIIPGFLSGHARNAPGIKADDDHLTSGSVLVPSADGKTCEHRLIDNQTWQIRPGGIVNCDRAHSRQPSEPGRNTSNTRVDAVRDAFYPRR